MSGHKIKEEREAHKVLTEVKAVIRGHQLAVGCRLPIHQMPDDHCNMMFSTNTDTMVKCGPHHLTVQVLGRPSPGICLLV